MANTKISDLTAATTAGSTDVLPVVQGGVTKKVPVSVLTPSASTTTPGLVELATNAETTTGTDTTRAVTPAGLKAVTDALPSGGGTVPAASTTVAGIVELATNAETTTGTDTARAVTPAGVKAVADTKLDVGSAVEMDAATAKTLTQNASATGMAADSGHTHRLPNVDGSGDISVYTADGTLVKLHSVGGVVGAASGGGGTGVASLYPFGDGSDGVVTVSTTVTLTRDMHYTDLTVTSAGVLKPNGWRIYVRGALTINTGGVIQADGTAAAAGANGAGAGSNQAALGQSSAGASATTVNGAGVAAPALTGAGASLGGAGGTGGASGANAGGLGGSAATLGSNWTAAPYMNAWKNPGTLLAGQSVSVFTNNSLVTSGLVPGSGGGSGANDATGTGSAGAGGGGGGFIVINANSVANSGTISASGGAGGAATATRNGGGGGGGGGGVVFVTCNSYTGTQPSAAGGAGGAGAGTGSNGATGNSGTVLVRTVA